MRFSFVRGAIIVSLIGILGGTIHADPEIGPPPRLLDRSNPELLRLPRVVAVAAKLEELPPPRIYETVSAEYRTVQQAIASTMRVPPAGRGELTGYLGISVQRGERGLPVVDQVEPDSPAAKAGIKKGDVIIRVGDHPIRDPNGLREWLQAHNPDEKVAIGLLRGGKSLDVEVKLTATSRPMKTPTARAYLGVTTIDSAEGGAIIEGVTPSSPAASAGLKNGDRIVKIDGRELANADGLREMLGAKNGGDAVMVTVRRDGKSVDFKATLGNDRGRQGGQGGQLIPLWKKDVMRLAIVCIEFPDTKHNAKSTSAEINKLLFSKGMADEKSVAPRGSLNDWLIEQSCGAFHIDGKVFDWVEVGKKRGDYIEGSGTSNKTAVLKEALEKLTARDGKKALDGFDAFFFIYAGDRATRTRGAVYWPHAGTISFQSGYHVYLVGSEGSTLSPIGAYAKEMVLALGMPDLAARIENAGSDGLGSWCAALEHQLDEPTAAFVGLGKGKTWLAQPGRHRPDRETKAGVGLRRELEDRVRQDPGSAGRQ